MSVQNEKYRVKWTTKFKKDYKQAKKRGCDVSGNWKDHRELHLEPDWILVYHIVEDILVLSLVRNGTHHDLFNK